MSVRERLADIRERIAAAARNAGRAPEHVRLLAVSKGHSASVVREAFEAGQRDFGENYVQEWLEKREALSDLPLVWHVIGHLQRNKAKHVAEHAAYVHSIDSLELARELGKRRAGLGSSDRLRALVEVSIAGESQKGGVAKEKLGELLSALEAEPSLSLVGLMCIPPLDDSVEASRAHFDALAELRDAHGGAARLPELSMGMTHDYEAAIAAGSTWVRVGTAIFGARPPRQG